MRTDYNLGLLNWQNIITSLISTKIFVLYPFWVLRGTGAVCFLYLVDWTIWMSLLFQGQGTTARRPVCFPICKADSIYILLMCFLSCNPTANITNFDKIALFKYDIKCAEVEDRPWSQHISPSPTVPCPAKNSSNLPSFMLTGGLSYGLWCRSCTWLGFPKSIYVPRSSLCHC